MWRRNVPVNLDPTQPAEFRQCFKCNYEAVANPGPCPKCHCPKFLTAGDIRTRGILGILVGLFLVVFMGAIAVGVGILLLGAAKDPANAKKMNQQSAAFLFVAAIFAAVIAFGLNAIVGGIWMMAFGRRNRVFVWIMWATLILLFGFGAIFRAIT